MSRKSTDYIIIHCAYTPPSMDIGAKEIDRWHRARGWLSIGYHYVIRRDGTVETGRSEHDAGAHAKGYNQKSIGICLIGGKAEDKDIDETNFTDAQWAELEGTVACLLEKYPNAKVIGHSEVSSKTCPTFDVQAWFKEHFGHLIETHEAVCPECGQSIAEERHQ